MTRVSKLPAERRKEILFAARELFFTQGFSKTSINDIVKKVGVAQGLFYYYFSSKEDIFRAVFELCSDEIVTGIQEILLNEEVSLNKRIVNAINILTVHSKGKEMMDDDIQSIELLELHDKLGFRTAELLVEPVTEILQRQTNSGTLNIQNPNMTARLLAYGILGITCGNDHAFLTESSKVEDMYELIARILNVPIAFLAKEDNV